MTRPTFKISISIFITSSLIMFLFSCGDPMDPMISNNRIEFSLIKSEGDTVKIIAKGDSASYSCSILGADINGLSTNGSYLELSVLSSPLGCISSANTYSLLCRYNQDRANANSAVYSNYDSNHFIGKINFSKADDKIKEGSFSVICYCEPQVSCAKDSVQILGTFLIDTF